MLVVLSIAAPVLALVSSNGLAVVFKGAPNTPYEFEIVNKSADAGSVNEKNTYGPFNTDPDGYVGVTLDFDWDTEMLGPGNGDFPTSYSYVLRAREDLPGKTWFTVNSGSYSVDDTGAFVNKPSLATAGIVPLASTTTPTTPTDPTKPTDPTTPKEPSKKEPTAKKYAIDIPVSFKPERGSAKAPDNTWFAFDYTLVKDTSIVSGTSYSLGGFDGYYFNNYNFSGYNGFNNGNSHSRRAPIYGGYGGGYNAHNGVASGYIPLRLETGNYTLTVYKVDMRGYAISPTSVTIRFTIDSHGRVYFNTNATRADFLYRRDEVVKKPTHNNPKTGDATNIALWSSMAVTSMAGVVVAVKKRRFK